MKRSSLTRKSELKAKTGLKRGAGLKRQAGPTPPREAVRSRNPLKPAPPRASRRRRHAGSDGRPKWMIPPAIRAAVVERDHGLCTGCRLKGERRPGTEAHHVMFRSQGGKHVVENLVLLCYDCHQGDAGPHRNKHARDFWVLYMAGLFKLAVDTWRLVASGKAPSSFTPSQEADADGT